MVAAMAEPDSPTRRRGPRAMAELMPAAGGAAFRRFGFQQSAVVARWAEIVGPDYARHSAPEALTFPHGRKNGGTLRVRVTGAFAPMLAHVEPQLVERINRFFGYAAVDRIQLRHGTAPSPPASHQGARGAPVGAAAAAPLPAETQSTLREIADPELRASLESLARALGASKGPPIIR